MQGEYDNPVVTLGVADPGCLSRIPDPDFYPSRTPDPKTATKEQQNMGFGSGIRDPGS